MLPPELLSLIMAMEPAPPEILERFRDDENLHEMAHALIDMLGLSEGCDEVVKILEAYDDHAFTVLLFHFGMIRPLLGPEDEDDIEEEADEEAPERLLN